MSSRARIAAAFTTAALGAAGIGLATELSTQDPAAPAARTVAAILPDRPESRPAVAVRPRRARAAAAAAAAAAKANHTRRAIAVSTSVPASPAAHGHAPGSLGVEGLSEKRLREFETSVLGPGHAREHAELRGVVRREKGSGEKQTDRAAPVARTAVEGDAAQVGRWNQETGGPFNIPIFGISAAQLPTGKVLWFAYPNQPSHSTPAKNYSNAYLWDPATRTSERVDPPTDPRTGEPANIWCSGLSFLADGRLLVTGGNLYYDGAGNGPGLDFKGLNHVYTFNPFSETWARQPNLAKGRWYPTQTLRPDGSTVITSGLDENGFGQDASYNNDVEVFTPDPNMDGTGGTVTRIGALANGTPSGRRGLYPHQFWMPSGRLLTAGPFIGDNWYLNVSGSGALDRDAIDGQSRNRLWSTAVLVPGGTNGSTKVLQLGGSNTQGGPATVIAGADTELFDEANPGLGWQPAPSLRIGRGHHNTVLLPDGSMVTVGGGVGTRAEDGGQWAADESQKQVELWDPATGQWRLGAAQQLKRAYHSTAVLLPDGRVVSAGDDKPEDGSFNFQDRGELYEPPYLFKGPRPAITSAPSSARWGDSFGVGSAGAEVTRAVLVAPGATTHANDMNQRFIPLAVSKATGGVNVVSPPNPNVALPGYYMLFLLSDKGVPSVARFVRLDGAAPDRPDLAGTIVPGGGTGNPGGPGGSPPVSLDRTAPKAKLRLSSSDLRKVRRTGRLPLRVTLDEAGTVQLKATVPKPKAKGRKASPKPLALSARVAKLSFDRARTRSVSIKLTKTAVRSLKAWRSVRVTVTVTSRDVAGNRRTTKSSLLLRNRR